MGFRFVQKSMTLNDLERPNGYAVTRNQKVICYVHNGWLVLVLLTYVGLLSFFPSS